jgi:hypothetical protein
VEYLFDTAQIFYINFHTLPFQSITCLKATRISREEFFSVFASIHPERRIGEAAVYKESEATRQRVVIQIPISYSFVALRRALLLFATPPLRGFAGSESGLSCNSTGGASSRQGEGHHIPFGAGYQTGYLDDLSCLTRDGTAGAKGIFGHFQQI